MKGILKVVVEGSCDGSCDVVVREVVIVGCDSWLMVIVIVVMVVMVVMVVDDSNRSNIAGDQEV